MIYSELYYNVWQFKWNILKLSSLVISQFKFSKKKKCGQTLQTQYYLNWPHYFLLLYNIFAPINFFYAMFSSASHEHTISCWRITTDWRLNYFKQIIRENDTRGI